MAKKKERLAKLCALVRSSLFFHFKFSVFLSPRFVPAPMPAFILIFVSAPFSRPGSPVILLSGYVPAPATVFCCGILAFLLPLPVLGPSLPLGLLLLRTFKQSLSNKPQPRILTSHTELFHPFLALDMLNFDNNNNLYNPTNNNKRKRDFNTAFINSRPLAGNYNQKEVDFSFTDCGCSNVVKLNRSWQLDLLDLTLVCIIEAILLAATQIWDPIFVACPCHTMKLVFKLGLKTNRIKSGIVKRRIKAVWANKIVSLLNRLFRNNSEWWTAITIVYAQITTRFWALC